MLSYFRKIGGEFRSLPALRWIMGTQKEYEKLHDQLLSGEAGLSVIGLGYVGMPLAIEFAKHMRVIGFNHNEKRIQQYKNGIDPTNEVGNDAIRS